MVFIQQGPYNGKECFDILFFKMVLYLLRTRGRVSSSENRDTNEGYTSYKFAFEQDERLHIALEIYVFNAKDKSTLNLPEDAFSDRKQRVLFYENTAPIRSAAEEGVSLQPGRVKQRFVVFDVNGVAQLASSK